ncbi:unnamed protein product [Trichobilharzia szidati]|nr:unnamed protein product [Trichobilharzia szidati]
MSAFSLHLLSEEDYLKFTNSDIIGLGSALNISIPTALRQVNWKISKFCSGYILIVDLFPEISVSNSDCFQSIPTKSSTSCDILFWRGHIYRSTDMNLSKNVGRFLLDELSRNKSVDNVIQLIGSLSGSFALIFVDVEYGRIYFTRDRFGRHSVVAKRFLGPKEDQFYISLISSSVIFSPPTSSEASLKSLENNAQDWFEIPASGIFVSQIAFAKDSIFLSDISLYPWSNEHLTLCPSNFPVSVDRILHKNESYIGITLPSLVPTTLKEAQQEFLDLLLTVIHDSVNWDLSFDKKSNLFNSPDENWSGSFFGLLFSGGLDSSVIAALVDRCVPTNHSIDLINVAFQRVCPSQSTNESTNCQDGNNLVSAEEAPDRQTALGSYDELCKLSPQRKWNLIKVNVDVSEIQEARVKHVWPLLLPGHTTVLDDSLGLALWFAARGQGVLHNPNGVEEKCTSSAKFLFLGSGIDEQLAGYARHLTTYKKFGREALLKELSKELLCISNRNLGRDDRLISAHGRMARLPYLDERIVGFLAKIPLEFKINPDLPKGQGEKFLLRKVAEMLNLNYASKQPKRAMQFGSRAAKAEGFKPLTGSADQVQFINQCE